MFQFKQIGDYTYLKCLKCVESLGFAPNVLIREAVYLCSNCSDIVPNKIIIQARLLGDVQVLNVHNFNWTFI